MKYVDEFRDRRQGASARAGDRARSPPAIKTAGDSADPHHGSLRRPHPFDLPLWHRRHAAEARSNWCMARAVRSAFCRWGASTIASPSPSAGRDLHDVRRRDARAGLEEEPVAGQGRRRRCAHGLFADGCARHSRAQSRRAKSSSSASASRPRCRRRRLTMLQAEAEGVREFLASSAITSPSFRRSRRCSTVPICDLDGFLGPGHVSMVIGTRPMISSRELYKKPMVVAGFEPLDILQSIWMVLKQIGGGPLRIENQYARVVPEAGNAPALDAVARVYELREFFEWRGLGSIDHSGREAARGICALRRRAQIRRAERQDRRSEILPMRRGAERRDQAVAVQGVRHRLHAGDAARRADGLVRRRLRRLLPIWRGEAAATRWLRHEADAA